MNLIFPHSAWWVLVCILAGILYAGILYFREKNYTKNVRLGLATTRSVVVSLVGILLVSPVLRYVKNTTEKPSVVFAIDNSQSLSLTQNADFLKKNLLKLQEIREKLKSKGITTDVQLLNQATDNFDKITFTQPSSDLGKMLSQIQNNYENRNLDKVVLLSDGIHNQGVSPDFLKVSFPIFTIGIGDTTSRKDLKVQALYFNKLAYLGNQFPIVAEVQSTGFGRRSVVVSLLQAGNTIATQTLNTNDGDIKEASFMIKAQAKGIQHYTVSVQALEGEWTLQNNTRDAFVEVIDGKEKILLLASAPHPDLKALKNIIEKNENLSIETHIAGLGQPKEDRYDLIIAHQIPDMQGNGNALLQKYKNLQTPIWYILGANTNVNAFNNQNSILSLSGRLGQTDDVFGSLNVIFKRFGLDVEKMNLLRRLPPLQAPYGDYQLKNGSEAILYQKVGNIETRKPLLALNPTQKSAVLAGEGLWQWRMEEYALTDQHEVIDDLVLKLVQFLSSKEDKRKLRVYTTSNEYLDYETVIFEAEAYNDVYEKISDVKVSLAITDDKGKNYPQAFTIAGGSTKFEVTGLPQGAYKYTASAEVMGKMEQSSGEFTVKTLQLEALTSTANHDLLRQISKQSNGKFYEASQLDALEKDLLSNQKPDILHSSEELLEIIHFKWLFFVVLLLISLEWVVRKYAGQY